MKLVKFKDGTYGVRKGNWLTGYHFYGEEHWWPVKSDYVKKYAHVSEAEARGYLSQFTDMGTPVKDDE